MPTLAMVRAWQICRFAEALHNFSGVPSKATLSRRDRPRPAKPEHPFPSPPDFPVGFTGSQPPAEATKPNPEAQLTES